MCDWHKILWNCHIRLPKMEESFQVSNSGGTLTWLADRFDNRWGIRDGNCGSLHCNTDANNEFLRTSEMKAAIIKKTVRHFTGKRSKGQEGLSCANCLKAIHGS